MHAEASKKPGAFVALYPCHKRTKTQLPHSPNLFEASPEQRLFKFSACLDPAPDSVLRPLH